VQDNTVFKTTTSLPAQQTVIIFI